MAKTKPTQPPFKALRKGSSGRSKAADACELLLEELQIRRERLHQLLQLIQKEASREREARSASRHICIGASGKTAS